MTRLCDTRGNTLQPPVGTTVTVRLGGTLRHGGLTVPGNIIRTTAQQIVVKYQPSGPGEAAQRWVTRRFWKKNGWCTPYRMYGPRVSWLEDLI